MKNEVSDKKTAAAAMFSRDSKGREYQNLGAPGACLEYNIRLEGVALRHASASQRRVRERFVV